MSIRIHDFEDGTQVFIGPSAELAAQMHRPMRVQAADGSLQDVVLQNVQLVPGVPDLGVCTKWEATDVTPSMRQDELEQEETDRRWDLHNGPGKYSQRWVDRWSPSRTVATDNPRIRSVESPDGTPVGWARLDGGDRWAWCPGPETNPETASAVSFGRTPAEAVRNRPSA